VLGGGLHVDDHHPLGSAEVLLQRRDDGVRGAQATLVRVQRSAHAQQAHAVGGAERVGLEGAGDAVVDVDPVGLQAEGGEAWRWAARSCPSVLTRA